MKIVFIPRQKGELDLALVYGAIAVFGLVGLRLFSRFTVLLPHCPFHRLTGISCPTCGATRCGILLSQFRILDAFLVNPLFVVVCLGIAVWAVSTLVLFMMKKRVRFHLPLQMKPVSRFFVIGCIVVNWVYLIYMNV